MKIQQIQSQNFKGKQRFLSGSTTKNIHELLNKMNSETRCEYFGDTFESKALGRLRINNEANFIDRRHLIDKAKNSIQGKSTLMFKDTELTIDNKSGEILEYKKPLFKSWKKVFKKADEIITFALDNFNNTGVVKKNFLSICGFTTRGVNKIQVLVDLIDRT